MRPFGHAYKLQALNAFAATLQQHILWPSVAAIAIPTTTTATTTTTTTTTTRHQRRY